MAKQSRRRRNAEPKRAARRRPQVKNVRNPDRKQAQSSATEKTVAVLHEAATAAKAANPLAPMERFFMQAFMPFAWLRPWMTMPQQKSHRAGEGSDMGMIKGESGTTARARTPTTKR